MAVLINQSMSAATRSFHTASHVFQVCEGMKPVQVLAALFHDVVYWQVDNGLPTVLVPLLNGVTRSENETLVLQTFKPVNAAVALCAAIFDFSPGQVLPLNAGMNEFLSAVVATRLLQPHLSDTQMLAVVACIAATIAFRPHDASGLTAADKLAQRVRSHIANSRMALDDRDAEASAFVDALVTDAVTLANRDIAGFTDADPRQCLSNTWQLLKEGTPALLVAPACDIKDYRAALQRMRTFLDQLDPALIVQHYGSYPEAEARLALHRLAARNVRFTLDYLEAELSFVAIVEALALATGTDCPMALLPGDKHCSSAESATPGLMLPEPPRRQVLNTGLLNLLESEHLPGAINDVAISPMKSFVYRCLGQEGVQHTLQQASQMYQGVLSPQAFLQTLERNMVLTVIQATGKAAGWHHQVLQKLEHCL